MADPTVGDVFNQLVLVNGKLDNIDTNTFGQANALNILDADVNKGFKATTDLLKVIALVDIESVKLLFHLTQQADTMICALEHISKNTCELVTQSTLQTRLQTRLADAADVIQSIAEHAYPAAALEQQRLAELKAQMEKCCPPDEPRPGCSYVPCAQPKPVGFPELPKLPREETPNNPPG